MADSGTILILDKDESNVANLSEFLRSNGYAVETADDGPAVIDAVRATSYDAIILDAASDDSEEAQLVTDIKHIDSAVEIVVVTEQAAGDEAMTAISRGATTYLQRPLRLPALLHRIGAAITTRNFHSETRAMLSEAGRDGTQLSRRVSCMERLLRFDRELMSIMDYRRAIDAMLNGLLDMSGADTAAVLLVRERSTTLVVLTTPGAAPPSKESLVEALLEQWIAWESSAPDIENMTVSGIDEEKPTRPCTSAEIAPLVVQDAIIGVLGAFTTGDRPLVPEAPTLLKMVAARTEVVVENAFLHEHTKILATTDSLTGLLNRRVFRENLNREFAFAHRLAVAGREVELSVIMSDVDFFKKFNDTYGHQLGDEVLKMAANCVMSEARRATDIAARYGGEEFIVIAPDTSPENAVMLAERIRNRLAETSVDSPHGKLHVTASFGVASYPSGGAHTPEELVKLADDAMYRAKAEGRNRVALAPSLVKESVSSESTST